MRKADHARTRLVAMLLVAIAVTALASCDESSGISKQGPPNIPPPTGDASYGSVSKGCLDAALSASVVYYVCDCAAGADADCVAGDDGAAGTSSATALRTIDAAFAKFNAMNGGEAVVLCRGGAFSVAKTETVFNTKCSAEAPCTLRDYVPTWASGDEPPPFLFGSGVSDRLISFIDNADANHDGGYVLHNLVIDGNGVDVGIFFYNDVDDVDLCNLQVYDANIGIYEGLSNAVDSSDAKANGLNERITLRGSYIHDTTDQGWLGAGDGLRIESNFFDYNGTAAVATLHSIYLDSIGNGITVSGNLVTHSTHAPGAACGGTAIVAHGRHDDLVIENNEVRFEVGEASEGCWGVVVDAAYGPDDGQEGFNRVVLRGNRVVNAGNTSIGLASCTDCVIENNLIVEGQDYDGRGIIVQDRPHTSEDLGTARVAVRSNTLVFTSAHEWIGVQLGTDVAGLLVADNAVLMTVAGWLTCFSNTGLATSLYSSDYNVCFSEGPHLAWGAQSQSLATVQSDGEDAHSQSVDPMFVPSTDDTYVPAAGSPLVDAADPTTSSPWDISGAMRGAKPDIGAFEAP